MSRLSARVFFLIVALVGVQVPATAGTMTTIATPLLPDAPTGSIAFGLQTVGIAQFKNPQAPVQTAETDPCVALVAYRTVGTNPTSQGVVYATTRDCGRTWRVRNQEASYGPIFDVAHAISGDGRLMTVAWSDRFDIKVTVTRDYGETWSEPQVLSEDRTVNTALDANLTGDGGTIAIAWTTRTEEEFESAIVISRSSDFGRTWQKVSPAESRNSNTIADYPQLCISDDASTINVVWETVLNTEPNTEKFHALRTSNSGSEWSRSEIFVGLNKSASARAVSYSANCQKILLALEIAADFDAWTRGEIEETAITTSNGGTTWNSHVLSRAGGSRDGVSLRSFVSPDGSQMWMSWIERSESSVKMHVSTDGGSSWSSVANSISNPIWGGAMISGSSRLVVISWTTMVWQPLKGWKYQVYIASTTDAGKTWSSAAEWTLRDFYSWPITMWFSKDMKRMTALWIANSKELEGPHQEYLVAKSTAVAGTFKPR